MADLKISQLTGATTPLAGTEVLPIVQSSTTKQVAVSDLTAGRSVSATSFVPTGSSIPANGVYLPAANSIGVSTNSTQRVNVDSTGNVLISSTEALSPATNRTYLAVKGKGTAANDGAGILQFQTNSAGSVASLIGNVEWCLPDNSSSSSYRIAYIAGFASGSTANNVGSIIDLATKADGVSGAGTVRQRIFSTGGVSFGDTTDPGAGNVRIGTGNLIQGTAAKGVNFTANTGAAGMTSQLLNWYEEGTFTPTISFGGASTGITYASGYTNGRYTRIGNRVFIQGAIILSNKGSATGDASINGLPFTNLNALDAYPAVSLAFRNVSYANQFQGLVIANTTRIDLLEVTEAGAVTGITNADFTNSSEIQFSASYCV